MNNCVRWKPSPLADSFPSLAVNRSGLILAGTWPSGQPSNSNSHQVLRELQFSNLNVRLASEREFNSKRGKSDSGEKEKQEEGAASKEP
jgi:hypothetical protein